MLTLNTFISLYKTSIDKIW